MDWILEEVINQTKNISFELSPSLLHDFGLKPTIEELAERSSNNTLSVSWDIIDYTTRFNNHLELAIYRIVQELVNNIVKHSKASNAYIFIEKEGGTVKLEVSDNGIGFNQEDIFNHTNRKSFGMLNIKNRVRIMN